MASDMNVTPIMMFTTLVFCCLRFYWLQMVLMVMKSTLRLAQCLSDWLLVEALWLP